MRSAAAAAGSNNESGREVSDPAARAFYEIEAGRENWSTPHLERQIFTALHLRLLKSLNKAGVMELARKGQTVERPGDLIKSPLILDLLGLSGRHFKQLVCMEDELRRTFYAEMFRVEGWSTRALAERIDGMLFERTALSKKPEALIRKELSALREKGELSPALVFRDPYMLDFLELADTYSEKDLESAILREIERFLLELGAGFAFVERQKRITLDGDDYYLDLLFFHRRMQRLVAIELKIGDFKPADSGQMELYLRWLDRHERQPSEHVPLGIILCAGKKRETVEYLDLDARGIHVAEYLTELPPREVLEERLHRAIEAARNRLVLSAAGVDVVIDVASTPKRKGRKK